MSQLQFLNLVRWRLPWDEYYASSLSSIPGMVWSWKDRFGLLSRPCFDGLELSAVYGPLYRVYCGITPVVVLASHAVVEQCYKVPRLRNSRFSILGSLCDVLMGESLGVKTGVEWKSILSTFQPEFGVPSVTASQDRICAMIEEWKTNWIIQSNGTHSSVVSLDVMKSGLYMLPLRIVGRLVYGNMTEDELKELEALCMMHTKLLESTKDQVTRLPLFCIRLFRPHLYQMLNEFQVRWATFNTSQIQRLSNGSHDSILGHLLTALSSGKSSISRAKLMHTIDEILLLNYDVTYVAIMATMSLLSIHPEYQERIRQEIVEFRLRSSPIHHLKDLKTLNAFILEVARLWPSLALSFPEHLASAVTVNGHVIPAGTVIVVDVASVNTDPQIWDHPLEFMPDRYIQDVTLATKFHRFGLDSRRKCLGHRYAELMIKLTVVTLVESFHIQPDPKLTKGWTFNNRSTKSHGLPYFTPYTEFPVLQCARSFRWLPPVDDSLVFMCGQQIVETFHGTFVLGMSLGNGFFNEVNVSCLIPFLLHFCEQLFIFIPDVPAEKTYSAMNYSPKKIKELTTHNKNRYKRWIERAIARYPVHIRSKLCLIDWTAHVETSTAYQAHLAQLRLDYANNLDRQFVSDVQDTTRQVMQRKDVDLESAVEKGKDFLLMELAFLAQFHNLELPLRNTDSSQLCYIYHRRWPVFERFMNRCYNLSLPFDSQIGFSIASNE